MKTSARNQFVGIIKTINKGEIQCNVMLSLSSGHELVANITRESCDELALDVGMTVIALVKSSNIIIATDLEHIRLSARNQLKGLITEVERGAVHAVVTMELGENTVLTSSIILQSSEQLNLHPGQRATAIFKAASVILGVLG